MIARRVLAVLAAAFGVVALVVTPVLGLDGEVVTSRAEGLLIAIGSFVLAVLLLNGRE